jgi:hypothetical protein
MSRPYEIRLLMVEDEIVRTEIWAYNPEEDNEV